MENNSKSTDSNFLEFAVQTAINAGRILKGFFDKKIDILTKSTDRDLVTTADLESEKVILQAIENQFPNHAILSEESGASGKSDYLWVIDPLDGTTNFAHSYPVFCVAMALSF